MFKLRFSLRTLFVFLAIVSLPLGWMAYQLEWIRRRHEFINRPTTEQFYHQAFAWEQPALPWSLKLFGESPHQGLDVPKDQMEEARKLFPEADIISESPEWSEAD